MTAKPKRQKVNYLNNADLLVEIHKSKMSFCELTDQRYSWYDIIVFEESDINHTNIEQGKLNRVKRINSEMLRTIQKEHNCTPKKATEILGEDKLITIDDINDDEVVFRLMCNDWIPQCPKKEENKLRTNFKPFKQFIIKNNAPVEVARSHWVGSFIDGEFHPRRGRLTEELGKMIIVLANRTSNKSNFRGYTYLDEMVSDATLQVATNALNFDESRETIQLNPFAYYTTIIHNAFRHILNTEKRNRNIRDDLLIENGYEPSTTRMAEIEIQMVKDNEERRLNEQTPKTTFGDESMWGDED
ncbi:hypothetical protein NVP2275O_430 [Vibrio phage 2.275.O._10N.286.54.E11]|nr:hypothetical protein NVP2275O_430 [Vibrio phage 2.275.O._10N.286.54.E11]